MSSESSQEIELIESALELTPLGKRLEILRIERGVSKQRLARRAGTSRQQLWRVMTGKSELTKSLRERLASALAVEAGAFVPGSPSSTTTSAISTSTTWTPLSGSATPKTLHEYLNDAEHLAATLRTLPSGDGGRRIKRALLNALEDLAVENVRSLPSD